MKNEVLALPQGDQSTCEST
ncbi:hypothetical protein C5167_045114 [Papaver somniferum]|uniref:Uncharacterized protein n=1 Tax=Papaver somniferum TaxID=3469 RepID=A0A4Y7LCR2_PAPSO|nr:hypothetical protein C5167_045114 [Papaver somniferum]